MNNTQEKNEIYGGPMYTNQQDSGELRIVLYSHDSQGLGHTRRNLAIAHALAARLPALTGRKVSGLLVTGEGTATSYRRPEGWDWMVIPGISKREGSYAPRHLDVRMSRLISLRSAVVEGALTAFRPHLVIVDRHAFGVDGELVDALAAHLVLKPWTYDVIVASNLLGDILSDLGSSVTGSIGVAPSANLNPDGDYPSRFEPVHGSAPDIAGKGLANPVGQIWSGAMMLQHLGHPEAAGHLQLAFESVLREGLGTRDVGGPSSTSEFTAAVLAAIDELYAADSLDAGTSGKPAAAAASSS